jgi:uncharacterized protein YbbK (DUF523 family)
MGRPLPRVGISACLLGAPVRYDGADKRLPSLAEEWRGQVEWVPVCPEVEVGMPVPREPIRLERGASGIRLVATASGTDWTDAMRAFAAQRLRRLGELSGYVFKARSPSCGPLGVPLLSREGQWLEDSVGRFAAAVTAAMPDLPVSDEDGLADPASRAAFLRRVQAHGSGA